MRALCLLLVLAPAVAMAAVKVENPWIAEPPPGAPVAGGFMVLSNPGDQPRELTAVKSPRFGRVELHQTTHEGGMARMAAQESIPVPANGRTELAHGGYHLMLMQAERPVKAGEEVPLVLTFDDGSEVEVTAPVRKMQHMMH